MGGGTEKTTQTQTSGLTNPAMQAAATTIGNQLNSQLQAGVKPYTESLVPALSSQTQQGINSLANNPNNSVFMRGIGDTIGQQASIAAGNVVDDPTRRRVLDDSITASNAVFTSNGRFGGDTHSKNIAESAANAVGALDYGRQQQAIANLPGLYSASQMPGSAFLQAGQIQDAWNAANAQDRERIFDVTNNAGWNTLQRGGSIFSGTAPISGTTTTGVSTQPATPWWQSLAGGAIGIGSMFL